MKKDFSKMSLEIETNYYNKFSEIAKENGSDKAKTVRKFIKDTVDAYEKKALNDNASIFDLDHSK